MRCAGWSTSRPRWTAPIRWAGPWPRHSCTRRATRCAAGPTRSCAGSSLVDWGCDDGSERASQGASATEERNERGVERGAELMSDQDLVVETVRDILEAHE